MPERFNPTPYEEAKKSDNTRSAIKHGVNSGSIVFNTASTRVNLLANHPNNPVSETTISASRERESTSSSGLTTGESLAPQISDKISDGENQVLIPQEHSYIAGTSKVGVELTGALTATPQATIAQNMELSVVARAGRDRDRFVDPEGIDQRIKVLREQGLGRAEIGRVLSISRGKVNHSVNMLIKSGEIPKKEGGRGSKEEIMAFDAQVKSLVAGERRVNIKELSERMRASYMKVRSSIHRLVEAKELPAELLGKGRQNSKRTQISLDIELSPKRGRSDIDSQVAELRAQGLFEIEIAEQLNEPRGKIRYAIRKLLKEGSISKLSESHPEFRKKQEYTKTRLGPGPTRIKFRELLQQHMEEHPDQRIELADYARELGISRERTRQLYRKLSSEMKVPGLKSRLSRAEAELVDEQVTILRRKGLSREEIARQVGINENMVGVSLRRSRKKLVVRVKDLYGQGVAETRIAKITGEAKGRIQHIIKKLVEAGEVQRLRVVIRREEYPGFLARVAGLRNANLTDQKIADQLKKPLANIRHAVRLLIARGEIQPRRHMRFSREERRILRDRVKQLRNQGFGNKEIEIALNIPRWKVSHLAAELIKAGEIRRIRRESTHTTTEQINA